MKTLATPCLNPHHCLITQGCHNRDLGPHFCHVVSCYAPGVFSSCGQGIVAVDAVADGNENDALSPFSRAGSFAMPELPLELSSLSNGLESGLLVPSHAVVSTMKLPSRSWHLCLF